MSSSCVKTDIVVDYSNDVARDDGLKAVAQAMAPRAPWTTSPISVVVISGGITNLLYRVSCEDEHMLVRVFGAKTEILIDRERDNEVFEALSDAKFGPHFWGTFGNGRVEGWIDAKPLEPPTMGSREPRDFPVMIGTALADMHSLDMKYAKEPLLWNFLAKWLGMAKEVEFADAPEKAAALTALNLPWIESELEWLQTVLPSAGNGNGTALAAASTSPATATAWALCNSVVFCHNDLLAGNILDVAAESRVQIIDFEYGGYNYLGFDLANHFCEYAGFDFDLDKWYPAKDAQVHFFRAYIGRLLAAAAPVAPAAVLDQVRAALATEAGAAEFYDALHTVVNQFTLASHCFWGLWAVIQSKYSPIAFDFMAYGGDRFGGYRKHKGAFFPSA